MTCAFCWLVWALFGVMGAWVLGEAFRRLPSEGQRLALRLLPLALIALAIPAAWMAVDHKTELLRDPLMSGEERHRVQLRAALRRDSLAARYAPPGRAWQ